MERKIYRCPKCGATEFSATAHVTQDWTLDEYGAFVEAENECTEVTHYPDDSDIWVCKTCGFDGAGSEFLQKSKAGQRGPIVSREPKKEATDMRIDGKPVVKFVFYNGYQKFSAETEEEAKSTFVRWINDNTKYHGLIMYAKHHGYQEYCQTADGAYYMFNGYQCFQVGEDGSIIREVQA